MRLVEEEERGEGIYNKHRQFGKRMGLEDE